MNSATKSHQKTQGKNNEDMASKKKRLQPYPEEVEGIHNSNSKKLKTGIKSVSKSKISTQKKSEVTFSEDVIEIKNHKNLESSKNKENTDNPFLTEEQNLTPSKTTSPSKQSLKSVKEHVKTPFSKIKDNEESGSKLNSSQSKTNQPNFNSEIIQNSSSKNMPESASKNQNLDSSTKQNKSSDQTPSKNSSRKFNEGRSRSKSPLLKIYEDVHAEHVEDKSESVEKVEKNDEINNENNLVDIAPFTSPDLGEEVADNVKNAVESENIHSNSETPQIVENADSIEFPALENSTSKVDANSPEVNYEATPENKEEISDNFATHVDVSFRNSLNAAQTENTPGEEY